MLEFTMSARAKLRYTVRMTGNDQNLQKVWTPLNLGNFQSEKQAIDRLVILDMIRQIYDPLLTAFLAVPGNLWSKQFSHGGAERIIQKKLRNLQFFLPSAVENIEKYDLGLYLYDILRYYRFTNPSWRVPLPPPAPEVVGTPHPEAPRVVPFTAINASWTVTNPAIIDCTAVASSTGTFHSS